MLAVTSILAATLAIAPAAAGGGPENGKGVPLCGVLESIRPGEIRPVITSGVFQVEYEAQVLFDPEQPGCDGDVQPATWVEFEPGVTTDSELTALLQHSRRAYVTVQGRLFGPGVLLPDDASLPFAAAFSRRVSNRRYGHLNSFRTKLVVEAILQVAPVPAGVPWEWGGRPAAATAVVSPEHLSVPKYPVAAREQGIAGKVIVEVHVAGGRVTAANVVSGDRVLAGDTVANIRTWRFDPATNTSFTTTFVYQLERRKRGDEQPRIELCLPESVRITAPSYDW